MKSKTGGIENSLNKYVALVSLVSILIIFWTTLAYIYYDDIDILYQLYTGKLGHFGDFIGGVIGVMLTFLATILIYFTYKSQKIELQLNRELFSSQQFENTFFNMLKFHQKLKKEIKISTENNRFFGSNEIDEKYKKYADIVQSQMSYFLYFIFYNALTYTNVKKYIEEFDFVENLMVERLLHPKHTKFEDMGKIK